MIKLDLITGFLGSGKTTFIKLYANYLIDCGYRIGIIENDYGAVNVDMMLLEDAVGEQCDLEMIAGGCDKETHQRRLKTKLIAMGMLGYDRILIEPSGIFDVDELFDVLYEEPINQWYEIGNVIAIVNAKLENDFSKESNYFLASQIANAGCIVMSRVQEATEKDIQNTMSYVNNAMKEVQCHRQFDNRVICKDWDDMLQQDFHEIFSCGYVVEDYIKLNVDQEKTFQSLYFMDIYMTEEKLRDTIQEIMNDQTCGKIFRIKGFMQLANQTWIEFNATHQVIHMSPIKRGQNVMIVIGERLMEENIRTYWNC